MDEKRATEILSDSIEPDGGLYDVYDYTSWGVNDDEVTLDGNFTAERLEAVAWWMRNKVRKE